MNKFIGVFDSGFGGINTLKRIVEKLPQYNYLYLGDSARTPYGTRSKKTVYKFTKQAVDFLFSNNCELIVFACNTASSEALYEIKKNYLPDKYPDKDILGVLISSVKEAVLKTNNKKIGVIATPRTVASKAFEKEIKKADKEITVFQKACPLLVPIVEAGEEKSDIANLALENYLTPLKESEVDTLILGCTHYGILESKIRDIMGANTKIISDSETIPSYLENYLVKNPETEKKIDKDGIVKFYSTDSTENFTVLGSRFFGKKIKVEKISLG